MNPNGAAETGRNPAREPAQKPSGAADPNHLLAKVLRQFTGSIEGLAVSFPVATAAIDEVFKKAAEQADAFLNEHAKEAEPRVDPDSGETKKRYTIDAERQPQLERVMSKLTRAARAGSLVPRSLFVSLVSAYDHFLGELIRTLLLVRPEILNSSEKTMKFSDLVEFDSIHAARQFVIEKEVETVLRGSHSDHFTWMENKFSVPLRKALSVWPEFIEITERRNLFVHVGGGISGQYLSVCAENKSDITGIERGKQLRVDANYFERACEVLLEIGVKLAQVLWRKLVPGGLQHADESLVKTTYDLIVEEKYDLAKILLDFAVEVLPRHSSEEVRLQLVFNRAQAYKWSGDEARARAIAADEDLSAAKAVFRLASAAIRDDVRAAITHLQEIGAKGDFGLTELREWPIFRRLREEPAFVAAATELFGEPLLQKDVDAVVPALGNIEAETDASGTRSDSTASDGTSGADTNADEGRAVPVQ